MPDEKRTFQVLRDIYPDPKISLQHSEPLRAIRDEHDESYLVVLDTNSLLLPYQIGNTELASIVQVYESLVNRGRLTIPGHVIREYVANRPEEISKIYGDLKNRKTSYLTGTSTKLLNSYPFLDFMNEFKALKELETEIDKTVKEFRHKYNEKADALLGKIKDFIFNDPVAASYESLFEEEIIFDPEFDDEFLKKDAEWRKKYSIPPGYKDNRETRTEKQNPNGDLIIWHTILKLGKERNKDLIFVTSEKKADWWHKRPGGDGETLYPRFELVDEFRRASGGHSFHIINLAELLRLFEIDFEIVEKVQRTENSIKQHISKTPESLVMWAVHNWIREHFQGQLSLSQGSKHFSHEAFLGFMELGFIFLNPPYSQQRHDIVAWLGKTLSDEHQYDRTNAILVLYDKTIAEEIKTDMSFLDEVWEKYSPIAMQYEVNVIVGYYDMQERVFTVL